MAPNRAAAEVDPFFSTDKAQAESDESFDEK
jgi:hypothetical protein